MIFQFNILCFYIKFDFLLKHVISSFANFICYLETSCNHLKSKNGMSLLDPTWYFPRVFYPDDNSSIVIKMRALAENLICANVSYLVECIVQWMKTYQIEPCNLELLMKDEPDIPLLTNQCKFSSQSIQSRVHFLMSILYNLLSDNAASMIHQLVS